MDHSFFLAPLVHVDFDPKNGHPFEDRGLVLVSVSASKRQSFPEAKRQAEFTIPRDVLQYGGFATVVGFPESSPDGNTATNKRDIYLFVAADNGLQLARAPLEHCTDFNAYNFFDPVTNSFTKTSHSQDAEERLTYMPGKYASGNIFYSPYFKTFLFVYFNNYADSTFFLRFLDLNYLRPNNSTLWRPGGRNGDGILAEDIEAMVHYYWSPEILIYRSPQGAAGYNYAGSPHPEYFNRQYFAPSMYAPEQPLDQRRNAWFGADLVDERHAGGDGRHLLLSWTAQVKDVRIPWKTRREIWLAKVEFTELSEAARLLTGDSSRYEHAAYQLPEWLASAGMKRRRRSWWKTVLSPK